MKSQEIKDLLFLMDRFVEEEMTASLKAEKDISEDEKNFLLILQKRLRKGKKEYGVDKFTHMMVLNMS